MKILCSLAAAFYLIVLLALFSLSSAAAEKTTIKVQFEKRPPSYVRALDSLGVLYLSVNDYVTIFGIPAANNAERKKFEIRLPHHRVKISAFNPNLVITELATNNSSVYQLPLKILFVDSMYYVPAEPFLALVERLSSAGISFDSDTRTISLGVPPATPFFDITGAEIEPRLNGYLLSVKARRKLGDYDAFLKQDGWLFVTIADAQADTLALNKLKFQGVIKRVLTFQSPTSVQLTFKVDPDIIQAEVINDDKSNNLLIALHTKSEMEKADLEKKRHDVLRERLENARDRSKLNVIVIDAGHGGKDPGTLGVTKTKEKDVTLAVALKLGKLIEQQMKNVKVVYTRKTDVFIELYRRAQIANEADGKLFISIHCNATERKPSGANGFEIYLLRPGKTESAIRIAERENSPIQFEEGYEKRYKELTEENFILVSMQQSAFVKYSEQFAEKSSEVMAKHLKIKNSGVKQAGFYVLVGASMPNVLVEIGYLSNKKEEKMLKSTGGQQKIAEALLQGIHEYKAIYEKAITSEQ